MTFSQRPCLEKKIFKIILTHLLSVSPFSHLIHLNRIFLHHLYFFTPSSHMPLSLYSSTLPLLIHLPSIVAPLTLSHNWVHLFPLSPFTLSQPMGSLITYPLLPPFTLLQPLGLPSPFSSLSFYSPFPLLSVSLSTPSLILSMPYTFHSSTLHTWGSLQWSSCFLSLAGRDVPVRA